MDGLEGDDTEIGVAGVNTGEDWVVMSLAVGGTGEEAFDCELSLTLPSPPLLLLVVGIDEEEDDTDDNDDDGGDDGGNV